ncbi:hypothetical protein G9A89_010241 [Geosiphon pyriformis]|nr:hypothetical protein G9A89_010241 [Geosiphon pyriformis]
MNPLYNSNSPFASTSSETSAVPAPAFTIDDFNTWDFSSIEDNIEAQKLLAAAIAHNDQYRFEDDSKRKLELLEDIITQVPVKANHNLNITSIPHTDLSTQDVLQSQMSPNSENQSSESQKKKPGRKPLTNTPSSKRKAQNRAAQRAFRERKERYVKELEIRIKELESQSAKTTNENSQLKSLVEQLQTENYILKQTTFTFDFPLDKANESSVALDKSINELIAPINGNPLATDPFTPPSSHDSDDDSISTQNNSPQISETLNLNMTTDPNFNNPSKPSVAPLMFTLPASDSSKDSNSFKLSGFGSSQKPQNAQEFCKKFTNGMCPDEDDDDEELESNDENSQFSGTNSDKKQTAFFQYRDPTPFTASIDNLSGSAHIPPLFEDSFENFGSYAPMQTPSNEIKNPLDSNRNHNTSFTTIEDIRDKKYLSCQKVWERINEHPNFDEFQGDVIDNLCNELKTKAKCSGNGPVVPEEEVDKLLIKLEGK